MFQIRELEMVHWDFWQAIKVPLDAQIVTVVGPNGSGKTTLLDALRTMLALKCSGRRDYKRYVRNNKENVAWLRGVVSNPRRDSGLFPTLFFPATSDEITLFCRIRKQGGDWVRQYAIAEGRIELQPGTESLLNWIGVNEYRRRLEAAGLTPAIAEVLALEQGDTDKLCEYSPKSLLDLVFQVFGDKQVLDHYHEAKLRLSEAEDELGKMEQQASQLGLDVERLKLRANNHLEWRTMQDNAIRLESRVMPALRYVEQWGALRGNVDDWRGARRVLHERRQALAALDVGYRELETSLAGSRDGERAAQAENDAAYAEFQAARDAARDTEKLLQEADRLRRLAEAEDGADAVALNDRLTGLKDDEAVLRQSLRQARAERDELNDTQSALQSGRAPMLPDFVRNMRAALDEAGIGHQLLTEIVEVRDPAWQEAVEALLAPSRHIILLNKAGDRQRAWELGQKLRYRHFIVPDREPVPRARPNSMLEVVDFNADVPDWLANLLNRTQRANSVAHGQTLDGDWITRDAFHKERRGARDISVRSGDYAFGEGARQSRRNETGRRLRELNEQMLADEGKLVVLTRQITEIQQALMGMQAVVQLAARQDEFAAAAARFHDEQTRLQDAGARLAAAQSAWQGLRDGREESRVSFETQRRQREALEAQIAELSAQLARQRDEIRRQIRSLRAARTQLPAEYVAAEHLRRLAAQYDSVRDVQREIDRIRFALDNQDWETDDTVLARRDKLAADYAGIERDTDQHRRDVARTRELTDDARAAYINKLRATVRAYGRNVKRLGELAGIDVELDTPHLENDDTVLAQAGLTARFNFDQKGMMGLNDGEASGGQQVMKSLILLIGLMMDDANTSGFVFIDEPFAHLDIFNIDRVGGFLKATQAQYLITTPLTHNTNVYGPSELTLTTRKKQPGQTWAPLIMQTRRRVGERETATGV
ncbi:ATP-binding protein [Jeongeupia sp. USM3]|uniref:ATP-binding protein n=1 Tax=Jeongeupia sp. USM3 TaxID=1906741 RepID=UPI00089E031D|nr:AAA family ATPase [Jeongeupia sp. USM3]AOY00639.1 chromosome segregation protein SMC [Jeongeupia sp. USM3]